MSRFTPLLLVPALTLCISCGRKSEAQVQAEASAKAAEEKVSALEKQLAESKGAKPSAEADAQTHEHLTRGQQKALERQLAEARQRASAAKQVATETAKSPQAPKVTVVTVPEGTALSVKLSADLSTEKAQAGDGFEGTLDEAVAIEGRTVWAAGAKVKGVVTQSVPAGRLASGKGVLAIKLTEVAGEGIDTDTFAIHGDVRGERNAKVIGGGAALGALVGILSNRDNRQDHALGGAAIGAAVGTAVAAGTADTVIRIGAAKPLSFKLAAAERITLKQP